METHVTSRAENLLAQPSCVNENGVVGLNHPISQAVGAANAPNPSPCIERVSIVFLELPEIIFKR